MNSFAYFPARTHSKPGLFYAGYASSAVVQAIVYVLRSCALTPDRHVADYSFHIGLDYSDFWGYIEAAGVDVVVRCSKERG